ncbi:MAG: amidohydrolase family protein [Christensenellales bacterium]
MPAACLNERRRQNLVEKVGVSFTDAVDFASANPAKNLGLYDERGSIEVGKRADFAVMDKGYNILCTVIGGKVVYKA